MVVSFGVVSMDAQVFLDGDPEGVLYTGHTGGYLGQGVSCVDFNNDGLDDLTFTQFEGQLLAYINDGQGAFLPADLGVSEHLTQPKAVYWVDLDNDGDKDLFVTPKAGQKRTVCETGQWRFGPGSRCWRPWHVKCRQDVWRIHGRF